MSHSHIGVPRFIEKGFSTNQEKVYCYDLKREKDYYASIDRLGTKNNYYDKDVEESLLGANVEKEFGLFYKDFCDTSNASQLCNILRQNKQLVIEFFSFMFARAKKSLEIINNESLSSRLLGTLNHSDYLKIQSLIKVNAVEIIGKDYEFYPLINLCNKPFINNSLGFGFSAGNKKEMSIILPLNTKLAIFISGISELKNDDFLFIEKDGDVKVDSINKCICNLEIEYGNGFIFGNDETSIKEYISYIKSAVKREKASETQV